MELKALIKIFFPPGFATLFCLIGYCQKPTSCASVGQRANSNGGANSCPNVNGTAYASNFVGTSYSAVPTSAKTGNLQLTYSGANAGLLPYAITQVWSTTTGTSIVAVSFGPASVPVVSGSTTQVNYCFYGTNLPTAGTLSLQLTDPQTGLVASICSYDASCNTNCTVTANPAVLPVKLETFTADVQQAGVVRLNWITAQEQNNKGFAVERSAGDGTFTGIAFVPTINTGGNSSISTSYEYNDKALFGLSNVGYRLRQEDLDGTATYSQVVMVSIPGASTLPLIYAAGLQLRVEIPDASTAQLCDITVYDTRGRTVKRMRGERGNVSTIYGLPGHSVYYVSVRSAAGDILTMKVVYIN